MLANVLRAWQRGCRTFADVSEPNIPNSAAATAMDPLEYVSRLALEQRESAFTIDLVRTNNQVGDGDAVLKNEDWGTAFACATGNATVEFRVAKVPVCRDDLSGSTLNIAHSGWDVESLGGSQTRSESGSGQSSEMHIGR